MMIAALCGPLLLHQHRIRLFPVELRAGDAFMTDLDTLVLGTGGILLMIAYAVVCDRI